ncbi:MAG: SH3 domain-containing C40 family peptidase [Mobilitalea sp.]
MNKSRLLKKTIYIATIATIAVNINNYPTAKAEILDAMTNTGGYTDVTAKSSVETSTEDDMLSDGTGVAGISLALDQYYETDGDNEIVTILKSIIADNEKQGAYAAGDANLSIESLSEIVAPEPEPTPVSEYANTGISVADPYVNIRTKPNEEAKVTGKLYKGNAATITDTDGDWVKIDSNGVVGYIKSEYLAIGFSAEELIDKYATKLATVTTETLKVRAETNTDCEIVTLIPIGETYEVLKENDEWVKIVVDEDVTGFVSKEYVDIEVIFEGAISIKEEQRLEKQAEAAKLAEEKAARELENERNAATTASKSVSSSSSSSSSDSAPQISSSNSSAKGSEIASFALNYVGNEYEWGGTSLTNGADCSGFVMSIYSHFGYSISRTSGAQSSNGSSVSLDNVQAGDLIFYASNGSVGHVAMYIGNGQVVHASSEKTGIKVSNMYYRTPYCARRILN